MAEIVRVSIHEPLIGPVIVGVPVNGSGCVMEEAMVSGTDDALDVIDLKPALVDCSSVIGVNGGE